MSGLGSGNDGEWTFIDLLSLVSLCIGLQNLELNISQNDLDQQTKDIDKRVNDEINKALDDIHSHLMAQDKVLKEMQEEIKKWK